MSARAKQLVSALCCGLAIVVAAGRALANANEEMVQLSRRYFEQRNAAQYSAAEATAREGLALAERSGNQRNISDWLNMLGSALRAEAKYSEAMLCWQQSLAIEERTSGPDHADTALRLSNLAALYFDLGDYAESESLQKRALAIREKQLGADDPFVAESLNILGIVYSALGKYEQAEPLLRRSLAICTVQLGPNDPSVAVALNGLGNMYMTMGDYVQAEPMHQRALRIFEEQLGADHPRVAVSLEGLGNLYLEQGRLSDAAPLYARSLAIRQRTFGPDDPQVAMILDHQGVLYEILKRHSDAEPLYQQALAIREKRLGENHPLVGDSLNNLAVLYKKQRKYAQAEPLFQRALAVDERQLGADHLDVALTLNNMAIMYVEEGKYAQADPLFARAIQIASKSPAGGDKLRRSYGSRAEMRWKMNDRPQAIDDLRRCLDLVEQLRKRASGGEKDRATYFGTMDSYYELMVSWQSALNQPGEVLAAMERGRARSLVDQMNAQGINLLEGLPAEQVQEFTSREREAQAALAYAQKQLELLDERDDLSDEQHKAVQQQLDTAARQAQEQVIAVYRDIRTASPAYQLMVSRHFKPFDLPAVQSWLATKEVLLLEYFTGEDGAYLLVVPPSGQARSISLAIDKEQAAKLGAKVGPLDHDAMSAALTVAERTIQEHLAQPELGEAATVRLHELWKLLLPEDIRSDLVSGKYKRLYVSPDGPLATLPFEALVVEPEGEPQYLLDIGPPIVYGPSASLLMNLSNRPLSQNNRDGKPVFTVGDPAYPATAPIDSRGALKLTAGARYVSVRGQLNRLPHTETESGWVVQLFRDVGVAAGQLLKRQATEANVRDSVAGRRLVHLACHGIADQSYGNFFGALALTPGPRGAQDASDDGFLTLPEIYDLRLAGTELSILSACETNFGPQQRGEGIWAISRGFLVAGSRRVVATNWLVDDAAAASLVSYFCSGAAKSEQQQAGSTNYAAALQAAKRWTRQQSKWSSPYYWAPFVLIGPD
ncbi:MAG: tetratricopeptide repeat protein [Pirellulales bacterium]